MGIHETRLLSAQRRYNEDKQITQVNRDYVKEFLKTYNVKPSTKAKFFDYIRYFLHETKDAKASIEDRKEMANIFSKLYDRLKPNGYSTAKAVAQRFATWLNDGDAPKSLSKNNIKQLTKDEKRQLKRVFNPKYELITWQDGLRLAKATNSIQLKAMLLAELDGGLRPSEFFALNYGDVQRDGKFFVLNLVQTKTSEPRKVVIYRAATFLNRWMEMHPIKTKNSPLWILESRLKSSLYRVNKDDIRYTYDAAKKILKTLARNSGFEKPLFWYNLRHSAVALAKQENLNVELASEKFGHSIKFYVETYGRLNDEAKINRFKQHYGEVVSKSTQKETSQICPVCDEINEPKREVCARCNSALTLKKALEMDKGKDSELVELKNEMAEIKKTLQAMANERKLGR